MYRKILTLISMFNALSLVSMTLQQELASLTDNLSNLQLRVSHSTSSGPSTPGISSLLDAIKKGTKLKPLKKDKASKEKAMKQKIEEAIDAINKRLKSDNTFGFLKSLTTAEEDTLIKRSEKQRQELLEERQKAFKILDFDVIVEDILKFQKEVPQLLRTVELLKFAPLDPDEEIRIAEQVRVTKGLSPLTPKDIKSIRAETQNINDKFEAILKARDKVYIEGKIADAKKVADLNDAANVPSLQTSVQVLTDLAKQYSDARNLLDNPLSLASSKDISNAAHNIRDVTQKLISLMSKLKEQLKLKKAQVNTLNTAATSGAAKVLAVHAFKDIIQLHRVIRVTENALTKTATLVKILQNKATEFNNQKVTFSDQVIKVQEEKLLKEYMLSEYTTENEFYYEQLLKMITLPDLQSKITVIKKLRDERLKPLVKLFYIYTTNSAVQKFHQALNAYSEAEKRYQKRVDECKDPILSATDKCKKELSMLSNEYEKAKEDAEITFKVQERTQELLKAKIIKKKDTMFKSIDSSTLLDTITKQEWKNAINKSVNDALNKYDAKKVAAEYAKVMPLDIWGAIGKIIAAKTQDNDSDSEDDWD